MSIALVQHLFNKKNTGYLAIFLSCFLWMGCHGKAAAEETKNKTSGAVPMLPAVDHTGIIVADADKEADRLTANFGVSVLNRVTMDFPKAVYKGDTIAFHAYMVFVDMGNTKIEYIQPAPDIPSPYLDILNEKGAFAHHLCFIIEDLDKELDKFARVCPDMEIVVRVIGDPVKGGDMAYVKGIIPGTLVELATLPH